MAQSHPTSALQSDLEETGLLLLGGFRLEPRQSAPPLADGSRPKTLCVVASAGPALWRQLTAAPEYGREAHPIDAWSKRVLVGLAHTHGAEIVFPFDGPPYWPFQQWILRLPAMSQSPLGIIVHRRYGPWFALRGALLFKDEIRFEVEDESPGPCPGCIDKPCLDACPASALTRNSAYDAGICRGYVRANESKDCAERGCLVRHACPYGREYAHSPEQAQHHMAAFTR